jgi:hypothetical protein
MRIVIKQEKTEYVFTMDDSLGLGFRTPAGFRPDGCGFRFIFAPTG